MNCVDCETWMDDFFNHELEKKRRRLMERHIRTCPQCRTAFQNYAAMLDSLHGLEQKACPDRVVDQVMDILNLDAIPARRHASHGSFVTMIARHRWRLGLIGAVACVLALLLYLHPKVVRPPQPEARYTQQEIDEAKDQVKLALSYFNKVTSETQLILESSVLPKHVVRPLKSSIKTAIKPIFNGGES